MLKFISATMSSSDDALRFSVLNLRVEGGYAA
jgi:hypothetical protein